MPMPPMIPRINLAFQSFFRSAQRAGSALSIVFSILLFYIRTCPANVLAATLLALWFQTEVFGWGSMGFTDLRTGNDCVSAFASFLILTFIFLRLTHVGHAGCSGRTGRFVKYSAPTGTGMPVLIMLTLLLGIALVLLLLSPFAAMTGGPLISAQNFDAVLGTNFEEAAEFVAEAWGASFSFNMTNMTSMLSPVYAFVCFIVVLSLLPFAKSEEELGRALSLMKALSSAERNEKSVQGNFENLPRFMALWKKYAFLLLIVLPGLTPLMDIGAGIVRISYLHLSTPESNWHVVGRLDGTNPFEGSGNNESIESIESIESSPRPAKFDGKFYGFDSPTHHRKGMDDSVRDTGLSGGMQETKEKMKEKMKEKKASAPSRTLPVGFASSSPVMGKSGKGEANAFEKNEERDEGMNEEMNEKVGNNAKPGRVIRNYIIVMGEALSEKTMGLYGAPYPTTPFMSSIPTKRIETMVSPSLATAAAVSLFSARENPEDPLHPYYEDNIISLAKEAGLKTYWVSSQGRMSAYEANISFIASKADVQYFVKRHDDFALIPVIQRIVSEKERWGEGEVEGEREGEEEKFGEGRNYRGRLIFVHTYGAHEKTCERVKDLKDLAEFERDYGRDGRNGWDAPNARKDSIPPSFLPFKTGEEFLDCYLASAYKADLTVEAIASAVQRTGEAYSLIFTSDHAINFRRNEAGEFVYGRSAEYKGQYEVPFVQMGEGIDRTEVFKVVRSSTKFRDYFPTWIGVKTNQTPEGYDIFTGSMRRTERTGSVEGKEVKESENEFEEELMEPITVLRSNGEKQDYRSLKRTPGIAEVLGMGEKEG